MQHCAIFRNRKNAKGREPKNRGQEPGLKGTGSGRFNPPLSPSPVVVVEVVVVVVVVVIVAVAVIVVVGVVVIVVVV